MSNESTITLSVEPTTPVATDFVATPSLAEQELVARAKTDPAAFGELYEANYDRIINYLYRRTLNVVVAEELTSNTFLNALRALPRFEHRVPIRAWLYRIAGNEINAHHRTAKRQQQFNERLKNDFPTDRIAFHSPEIADRDDAEEQMKRYAALHGAISTIPEHYQEVLVLRYFEGLKLEEVAQVLNKRVGTVKSLVHRGLARLRKNLPRETATFSP